MIRTRRQRKVPATVRQMRAMFQEMAKAADERQEAREQKWEAEKAAMAKAREARAEKWEEEKAAMAKAADERQKQAEAEKVERDKKWEAEKAAMAKAAEERREARAVDEERRRKEAERTMEDLKETVKRVSQQLGGMANSDGASAEEFFATSLASKMMFAGQQYDTIDVDLNRKIGNITGQFDTVLYNCTSVAIIEVKNKAKLDDLDELINKKLPRFRALFPYYKDHAVYFGIGSMSFDKKVLERAHELGIGILRQKGDTIEADSSHVRAY
ncbi:hypothetical protein ACYULU_08865 [Breznakiellaceae bacterium SP9]